jgi:hypothetical protein
VGLFLVLSYLLGAGVAAGVHEWCRADRGKELSDAEAHTAAESCTDGRADGCVGGWLGHASRRGLVYLYLDRCPWKFRDDRPRHQR